MPNPSTSFATFARKLVLDSGKPLKLERFQKRFVDDIDAGVPECWLIIPEGNGKTTLLAAFALWHVQRVPFASVVVAASTRDQAMLLYRQAKAFVMRSGLGGYLCQDGTRRIKYGVTGVRYGSSSESVIQIFAADAGGGDGVIPTLAVIDEPHRHRSMDLYLTWSGKLGKRAGQLVAISTAGEPGSEFEEIRERIRQEASVVERDGCFGRFWSQDVVLHEWAVPEDGDVEDIRLVKAANPLPSITAGSLKRKREKPTMTLAHWRRFTCNMPTRSVLSAVTEREWADLGGSEIPVGEEVWCGFDAGWRWDTTAVVPLWLAGPERRVLGEAKILVPPRNGDRLDLAAVLVALEAVHLRNPIHTLVADPSDARDVLEWARSELGCEVLERPQRLTYQADEYEAFMEALRNGWLRHSDDPGLTRHVLNAVVRVLPRGDAIFERPAQARQAEGQDRRVIDALRAAAMVNAVAGKTAAGSVYDERGMVAV